MVRRFSVHDDASFSVEQLISMCVVRRKAGGWVGESYFIEIFRHAVEQYRSQAWSLYSCYPNSLERKESVLSRLPGNVATIIICDHGRDLEEGPKGLRSKASNRWSIYIRKLFTFSLTGIGCGLDVGSYTFFIMSILICALMSNILHLQSYVDRC